MNLQQIIEEIEEYADFDLKELSTSTVYMDSVRNYRMIDIWKNRENALKVLVDLRYNGYTIIPF